jgi:hypothetical protein
MNTEIEYNYYTQHDTFLCLVGMSGGGRGMWVVGWIDAGVGVLGSYDEEVGRRGGGEEGIRLWEEGLGCERRG